MSDPAAVAEVLNEVFNAAIEDAQFNGVVELTDGAVDVLATCQAAAERLEREGLLA